MSQRHDPAALLAPQQGEREGFFTWLRHAIPTALVMTALGGIGYWGFRTHWNFIEHAPPAAGPADWDERHELPLSQCVECNPALMPRGRDFRWCERHGVHDCPWEHPEVAQLALPPRVTDEDRQRADRALTLRPRATNDPKSSRYRGRVQFASEEAIEKAGVSVVTIFAAKFTESIPANGEVNYDQTRMTRLTARVPGTTWRVLKKVGDPVRRGDVLALVNSADVGKAKAEFLQALVQARQKSRSLDDVKSLTQLVPAQVREAEAALRDTEIRLLTAEQALANLGLPVRANDYRKLELEEASRRIRRVGLADANPSETGTNLLPVRSPQDGEILACDIVVGEPVGADRVLFTVADVSRLWLTLYFAPEDARQLALELPIRFRPNGTTAELEAKLIWVSSTADEKTRRIAARAELVNDKRELRAGTFGTGRVVLREEEGAIVAPAGAVQFDGRSHFVFVRDKDFLKPGAFKVFHAREVRVGARDGDDVEIIAGLLPDEIVVAKGSDLLLKKLLSQ